ncbi:hypothetical protein [Blastococcus sp. URHD0036]|uniref:hypothetical protein n=1 Tax=Blastococcus sp. URHD0036 TaxID=1380356 RepID=UPI0004953615|nr:hypothetical protein [Blastococcus sp. URHD0036]
MGRRLALTAALCLTLAACTDDLVPPASADRDDSPSWYGGRSELPSCGIDEPHVDGYRRVEARNCFRAAVEADRPAELSTLQYGDEGESVRAHFRVLGDGRYEIVAEQLPGSLDPSGPQGWVRYECTHFLFIDDPGAELLGQPEMNHGGECTQVEYVEG